MGIDSWTRFWSIVNLVIPLLAVVAIGFAVVWVIGLGRRVKRLESNERPNSKRD